MTQRSINLQIIITTFLLAFVLFIFQYSNIDIKVQEHFYNFSTSEWIWSRNEPISKLLLYTGLKKILIIFALTVLFMLILFWKKKFVQKYKTGMIIIVLSSIIVPSTVITLKNETNIPCPKNIEHFNGKYPDIKVFDSYPNDFVQKRKIRCWPAGHASAGFALMSLFFFFKKRKNQIIALLFALSIGWIMGSYKMIIGDHFLSHTIITMFISWLEILIIAKFFDTFHKDHKLS